MTDRRTRRRLNEISRILEDIEAGNRHHQILADPGEPEAEICFQINRIVEQLNRRIEELERKERAQRRLLTGLSHDLRTPLASVMGYLEALDEGLIPKEKRDEFLHTAREKSQRLKLLVDQLFDWFKLESGEYGMCPTVWDINEATRELAAEFVPLLERRGFSYGFAIDDGECLIRMDRESYDRIVRNLMENAMDHSGGTKILLSLARGERGVTVTVADDGQGIQERDLPYLFDRMYRGDPARMYRGDHAGAGGEASGSGLGLSIVRALARAQGGDAAVVNGEDGGAVFTVFLPYGQREEESLL